MQKVVSKGNCNLSTKRQSTLLTTSVSAGCLFKKPAVEARITFLLDHFKTYKPSRILFKSFPFSKSNKHEEFLKYYVMNFTHKTFDTSLVKRRREKLVAAAGEVCLYFHSQKMIIRNFAQGLSTRG